MKNRAGLSAIRAILIASVASVALQPAWAQSSRQAATNSAAEQGADTASQATEAEGNDIVVTGIRASVDAALNRKFRANQIVDSIESEDIGKFPDANVAESLQRITGVQISRDKSEGAGVAIRGLSSVRIELNGRSYYSSISDIPSELVAGLDVYKSFSAEQTEGGLGGLINIRTRRPFDFDGFQLSTSVGLNYYENTDDSEVNSARPRFSGLISDRWNTGIGEMGALVNVAYQDVSFTRAGTTVQPYSSYADIAGQPATAPVGFMDNPFEGRKSRFGVYGTFQWAPTPELELHLDANYTRYRYDQNSRAIVIGSQNVNSRLVPATGGTFEFYEGSNDLIRGDFQNVPVESFSYIGAQEITTKQVALGGTYDGDRLDGEFDVSYTRGSYVGRNWQASMLATVPLFTLDVSSGRPVGTISGGDLTDPSQYKFNYFYKLGEPPKIQTEKAARADLHYQISETGFLRKINFGGRYVKAEQNGSGWFQFYTGPNSGKSITGLAPNLASVVDSATFGPFLSINPSLIRDSATLCDILGIGECEPAPNPARRNGISQEFIAGYLTTDLGFDIGSTEISGTAGARVVRTTQDVYAYQNQNGALNRVELGGSNTKVLPSINVRANFSRNLVLRAAASKSLSQVGQGTLNPVVDVNPNYGTGSAGNPDIQPFTATNYDVSLERYFGREGIAYIAGFYKEVNGFLQNVTAPETIDGQVYQITRPQNGPKGTIKGFEVGLTTFFDFLPAPLDGLGTQLNYTYVDSAAPGPVSGEPVPLTGLSKNSYNLIGLFEKGIVSARVAYNWRDTYVVTTSAYGAGSAPIFAKPYGQLDASLTFNFTPKTSLTIDAVNLNGVVMPTYYGAPHRPYEIYSQDRRFGLTFRNTF